MSFKKNNQVFAKIVKNPKGLALNPNFTHYSLSIFGFIQPLIIILCIILGYGLYNGETKWLEGFDSTPIKSFAITNQPQFTNDADIRDALLTGFPLKGYFGQEIKEVEKRLLAIPWVNKVIVRKIWPDKLSITLFEHHPVALWNNNQLLSDEGIVFNLPFDRINKAGFPILSGPNSEGKRVLDAWWKIKQDLIVRHLELKSITVDKRDSWKITLSDGIILLLGRGEWIPKIDRFVKIFPQINIPDGKVISYVDLRYKYGAAVGFVTRK